MAVCAVLIGTLAWYRELSLTPAALLKRLPARDALVLYVGFDQLRRGGILQLLEGSKVGEDPEYQAFVRKTQFDYKQDLDAALVAFAPNGKYLFLRGRFDWKSLRSYAFASDGECYNSLCRMAGSTAERRISFFPVQSNLMALAVSSDDSAALAMSGWGSGPAPEVPDAPVWLSIPASVIHARDKLPTGMSMFARAIEDADKITIAFQQESNHLAAKLIVYCRNERDAATVATELASATGLLRDLIAREHQRPNPRDWSGVLTAGTFRSQGRQVFGYWPIERVFVETMLGGAG